jgi:hypothetical protein
MAQTKIIGLENLTADQLSYEVEKGGRFVVFVFCISALILTFKQSSPIYFIRAGESDFKKSLQYTLFSLFLGWWGLPWGPIYTLEAVITNLAGGKNITPQVMASLGLSLPAAPRPAGMPTPIEPAPSPGPLRTIAAMVLFLLSGLFLLLSLIGLLLVIGHLITFLSPPPGAETPTLAQFGGSLFCFASTLFVGALLLIAGVASLRRRKRSLENN